MKKFTENEINILMADRCTRSEAEASLKRGTQIWSNPEEWLDNLKKSGCYDGQTIEAARAGRYAGDVRMVEYNGHEFLIEYAN